MTIVWVMPWIEKNNNPGLYRGNHHLVCRNYVAGGSGKLTVADAFLCERVLDILLQPKTETGAT